ncbi:MAG: hypothetical protein NVV57_07800 [Demequina sp.]|nr:hypothetical protein [Demequina sp.]
MSFLPPVLSRAGIGADGSVNRASFGEADLECRAWFGARADELGLMLEVDRNGNQWAWWDEHLPGTAVVVGSHLDSVPDGGGGMARWGWWLLSPPSANCARGDSPPPGR